MWKSPWIYKKIWYLQIMFSRASTKRSLTWCIKIKLVKQFMVNDPISDVLAHIKNGYLAKRQEIEVPYSKFTQNLIKVLHENKYISSVQTKNGKEPKMKKIILKLEYTNGIPAVTDITRISKPGKRVYMRYTHIPKVFGGLGISVISTPKGLMTGYKARKEKLGGEVICNIW